jgi:alkanesulfonate monooxygenase SsuD/methylene tetrahydromethanopterin reductase-like flavin-dependent oxidoreductase (luciferase family)
VVVAATEAEAASILDRLPAERRSTMTAGTPEQAADGLRPYIDAGFRGFTFNNTIYSRPEQIAVVGELLALVA